MADQRGAGRPRHLRARRDAVRGRHPGDRARPGARPACPPRAEALLYAADRAQHVHDVLRPALDAGEVVITDRFVDSSLAYQGAGRTIPLDEIRSCRAGPPRACVPDLTVLLDLPPEDGLARARGRAAADRLESESLDFHQRVRADLPGAGRGRRRPLPGARRAAAGRGARRRDPAPGRRAALRPAAADPARHAARLHRVRAGAASGGRRRAAPPARPDRADPAAAPVTATLVPTGVWAQVDRPARGGRRAAARPWPTRPR